MSNSTEYELADLLMIFESLLPISEEERGYYVLQYTRSDDITVQVSFSVPVLRLIFRTVQECCIRKCLEVKSDRSRVFIALDGN